MQLLPLSISLPIKYRHDFGSEKAGDRESVKLEQVKLEQVTAPVSTD